MKNILFIVNPKKDNDYYISKNILSYLKEKEVLVYVDDSFLAKEFNLPMITKASLQTIDFSIILGGDGTIIKYLRTYGDNDIPLLGVNIGRVGALAVAEVTNFKELIDNVLVGKYVIYKYFTLKGKIKYENGKEVEFDFYNDAILHRGLSIKLLPIDIEVNNSGYDRIYADGVVVSTPSGSSAYNHSAGGPLLSPKSNCYVITPICSQTHGFSSLVVSSEDVLNLKTQDSLDGLILSVDGSLKYEVDKESLITIEKGEKTFGLIQFENNVSLYKPIYKVIDSINSPRGHK